MKSYNEQLTALRVSGNLRHLPEVEHQGIWILKEGMRMLNLSSNDYLGLASRQDLQEEFQASTQDRFYPYSSSSSRLLTGNFSVYTKLEKQIARSFDREAALIFNSGYHANTGILPALADKQTLLLADKLVHASIIDGILLSGSPFLRFATQLNFYIDDETFEALSRNKERIHIISKERIADELNKILLAPIPSKGFIELDRCGLLPLIFPEFSALQGVDVKNGRAHKDNFYHTLENEKMKYVQKLVGLHMRPIVIADDVVTDSAVRRLLFEAGDVIDDLMMLCEADITSKNEARKQKFLDNFKLVRQKLKDLEEKDRIRNFQPPVDGEEIMRVFDMKPCREIGSLKSAIKDAILDGVIPNEHDAAFEYMLKKAKQMKLTPKNL